VLVDVRCRGRVDVNAPGAGLSPLKGDTSSVRSMKRELRCSSRVRLINSGSVSLVVVRCTRGGTGIGAEEGGTVIGDSGMSATVTDTSMGDDSGCG
jgi:hypothetical protein